MPSLIPALWSIGGFIVWFGIFVFTITGVLMALSYIIFYHIIDLGDFADKILEAIFYLQLSSLGVVIIGLIMVILSVIFTGFFYALHGFPAVS